MILVVWFTIPPDKCSISGIPESSLSPFRLVTRGDVILRRACVVTTQSVIWALTMHKRNLAVRDGWGSTPVVKLVARDGAVVFFAVCGQLVYKS